jgi:hypothetical protein
MVNGRRSRIEVHCGASPLFPLDVLNNFSISIVEESAIVTRKNHIASFQQRMGGKIGSI